MKLINKDPEIWTAEITCGDKTYPVHITKLTDTYSLRVPMGDTEQDKSMFDTLIYYNQATYHAKTKEQVIKQVQQWIEKYLQISSVIKQTND